jgi:hypothetical protein
MQHVSSKGLPSRFNLCLLSLLMIFCSGVQGFAQGPSPSAPQDPVARACSALMGLDLGPIPGGPARLESARVVEVPQGGLDRGSPMGRTSGFGDAASEPANIKRYCEVKGYVAPQSQFELRLPLDPDWNAKFLFFACGGFCGVVDGGVCTPGLMRGYASVTSNGGHEGAPGFDGVWAAGAPNLQEEFGWRSNHAVTLVTKYIVTQYYGHAIQHAYMTGCSKGGQAVLMTAQRYPDDFDGLLPMAPVYDYTGRGVIAAAWLAQAVSDGHGGNLLDLAAIAAIHKSVLKLCGAQSGVDEGMVTDPENCKWQPETIACDATGKTPDCLTSQQVSAVKKVLSPPKNAKGETPYPFAWVPGSETDWIFVFPGGPSSINYEIARQFLTYLVDEKPRSNADPLAFDFDKDINSLARARSIYDATSFDLRAFKARGGKMLLWHGMADGGISVTSSIGYYQGVTKFMGGRKQTEDFFRMYLIPGVHHCGGGPGLTDFDALTLLDNWVEKGQEPQALIASRRADGVVERARPIYPYPVQARYFGSGNPKQSDSFAPSDPTSRK